jgi:hypothetical protein
MVAAVFAVGLFTGTLVISIGVGSEFTGINTMMSPLVCPGDTIVPAWKYHGRPSLADGPELRTRWICVDESTHKAHVAGYRTIFTTGLVYAVLITLAFLAVIWIRQRQAGKRAGPSK